MMSLEKEHIRVCQIFREMSTSLPLILITKEQIRELEERAISNNTLSNLNNELLHKMQAVQSIEDHAQAAQLYEAFFECWFVLEMENCKYKIERTPGTGGQNQKRPDFVFNHTSGKIYFELKALEIADPLNRHSVMAEEAFENAAELESRSKEPGVHIGNAQCISGPKPGLSVSQRIDATIRKIEGQIKSGQINYGPTVLVVDLGRHTVIPHGPSNLLPVFFNAGLPGESCVSGELWHIGFGQVGERIFKLPEAEGLSNLDGHLRSEGILLQYPGLLAIMFHLPRWNRPSEILTLWNEGFDQSHLENKCILSEHDISEILYAASDGMNNNRNELGWNFTVAP